MAYLLYSFAIAALYSFSGYTKILNYPVLEQFLFVIGIMAVAQILASLFTLSPPNYVFFFLQIFVGSAVIVFAITMIPFFDSAFNMKISYPTSNDFLVFWIEFISPITGVLTFLFYIVAKFARRGHQGSGAQR